MSMRHQASIWDEIDPNNLLRRWLDQAFNGRPVKFSITPEIEDTEDGPDQIKAYDIHVELNEDHDHTHEH